MEIKKIELCIMETSKLGISSEQNILLLKKPVPTTLAYGNCIHCHVAPIDISRRYCLDKSYNCHIKHFPFKGNIFFMYYIIIRKNYPIKTLKD